MNRAGGIGAPLFCGRTCSGLARRKDDKLTGDKWRAHKAAYDKARRDKLGASLLAEKRAAYHARVEREGAALRAKQKAYRDANMARHVEYCRRPEYRMAKVAYDRRYRADKEYGPFADAFLVLQDVEFEIASRASRQEIYEQNGIVNKSLKRKREYEKAIGC
jgi:hypothetical protein